MELLLQAIEERLSSVDAERRRWQQYKDEHVQAEQNLTDFPSSFRKEILVPIGSKALMPGALYHTNEIFVGMYRGLFVKCSANKALDVCKHRLDKADRRLTELDEEYKMYKDRLEYSSGEGAFGVGPSGQQEIVEEYNEETEREWREQHKIRVREQKQREAEERKNMRNSDSQDKDIMAMLEQAELMEELENELDELNIDSEDRMQAYLDGNESQKPLYQPCHDDDSDPEGSEEFLAIRKATAGLNRNDKIALYEKHLKEVKEYTTNCLTVGLEEVETMADKRVTQENLENAIEELQEELESDETGSDSEEMEEPKSPSDDTMQKSAESKSPCPTAPSAIESTEQSPVNQCKNHRKIHSCADFERIEREYNEMKKSKSELLVFYKSQLRGVMKSIASCSIDANQTEMDEKRNLYDHVADRIDQLRAEILKENQIKLEEKFVDDDDIDCNGCDKLDFDGDAAYDLDDDDDNNADAGSDANMPMGSPQKRRISFASQPSVTTYHLDDEPWRVQTAVENNPDSINSLMDATFQFFNSPSSSSASSVCGDDDNDDDRATTKHINHMENDYASIGPPIAGNGTSAPDPVNSTNKCDDDVSTTATSHENSSPNAGPTLHLYFTHSENVCTSELSADNQTINSPLDIYKQFGGIAADTVGMAKIDSPTDSDQMASELSRLKEYVMRVANLSTDDVYDKMKANIEQRKANENAETTAMAEKELSNPEIPFGDVKPKKSILKNRDAVKSEVHGNDVDYDQDEDSAEDSMQPFFIRERSAPFTGFSQVLGDVMERSSDPVEDPYVDNNIPAKPAKKVSLFKLNRMS